MRRRRSFAFAPPVLSLGDIEEADEEEDGQQVEQPVFAIEFSGGELQKCEGKNADSEAIGDGVGERNHDEGKERGDGNHRVGPANFTNGGEHHAADEDERGSSGRSGYSADERREKKGAEKKHSSGDGGDAAAASGSNAGAGFNVAGNRAGAGKRTANGCGCIGEENSAQAWDGVIGFDQSSLLCDREQCAEIVEQIDEEEYEDNFKQADVESTTNIQAESGGGDAGKIVRSGMPLDEPMGHARAVVASTPMRIEPRTFHISSEAINSRPKSASAVSGRRRLPSVTKVTG